MELVTTESLTTQAVAYWKEHHGDDPTFEFFDGRTAGQITKELDALGPEPKAEDINRIIGNESWTTPHRCDECEAYSSAVVRLGQEPDMASNTAHICQSCLQKALGLFH